MTARAQEAHLVLPLYTALHYLHDFPGVDIPDSALRALESAPISQTDRVRLKIALHPPSFRARALRHYDRYTRVRRRQDAPPSLNGFLHYLQQVWEVEHVWQTPLQGAKRLSRILLGTLV